MSEYQQKTTPETPDSRQRSYRSRAEYDLCQALAQRTNTHPAEWFPVFKSRYGLEAVYTALHTLHTNGLVLTQTFTTCTAIDPILSAQLTPVYGDINPRTLNLDADRLITALHSAPAAGAPVSPALSSANTKIDTSRVQAVVMQNTFGIIDQPHAQTLAARVRETFPQALFVENSMSTVTRMARNSQGEPLADVSAHSFGFNNILGTSFGGAIWLNPALAQRNGELYDAIVEQFASLRRPTHRIERAVEKHDKQDRFLARLPQTWANRLRARWIHTGKYEPELSAVERQGSLEYSMLGSTDWIDTQARLALDSLEANFQRREMTVSLYSHALTAPDYQGKLSIPQAALATNGDAATPQSSGINSHPQATAEANSETATPSTTALAEPNTAQPLLYFPVLLANAEQAKAALQAVRAVGVAAQHWYRPQLFPGVMDPAVYNLPSDSRNLTTTKDVSDRIVVLPTNISDEEANKAIAALRALV